MRTTHYDFIPSHLLHGSVLDVGCGDGSNQRRSTQAHLLQSCDYTGMDITQGHDIFTYDPPRLFDTVLAIHVIEHIELERWPELFRRLCSWVKPNGHLVIGTPYRQKNSAYYQDFHGPPNQRHVVFGIDEALIAEFISPLESTHYQGPYSPSLMCIWRNTT